MAKIISGYNGSILIDGFFIYPLYGQPIFRRESGFTSEGVRTFSQYASVRQQYTVFGRASHVAKVIRLALKDYIPTTISGSYVNRLNAVLRKVLHYDKEHAAGQQEFDVAFRATAARGLLRGFSFSSKGVPLRYELLADRIRLFTKGWKRKHREGWFGFRVIALEVDFAKETTLLHYGLWHMIPKERMEKYFRFYLPPVADSNAQVFYLLQSQLYAENQGSFAMVASDVENLYFL